MVSEMEGSIWPVLAASKALPWAWAFFLRFPNPVLTFAHNQHGQGWTWVQALAWPVLAPAVTGTTYACLKQGSSSCCSSRHPCLSSSAPLWPKSQGFGDFIQFQSSGTQQSSSSFPRNLLPLDTSDLSMWDSKKTAAADPLIKDPQLSEFIILAWE